MPADGLSNEVFRAGLGAPHAVGDKLGGEKCTAAVGRRNTAVARRKAAGVQQLIGPAVTSIRRRPTIISSARWPSKRRYLESIAKGVRSDQLFPEPEAGMARCTSAWWRMAHPG